MKTHNKDIIDRGNACKVPHLREKLHALELNGLFITRDKAVVQLAKSLSRATKRESGTRFSTRTLPDLSIEVQRIRHH